MENRLIRFGRGTPALIGLASILVITLAWWMLALWPLSADAPQWIERTRYVCFGAASGGLPDAGGWILLIGQPIGMIMLLVLVWRDDLRTGMQRISASTAGQISLGAMGAALIAGVVLAGARVREANAEPFVANPEIEVQRSLTRISDVPPRIDLIDQFGDTVRLDRYRGRAVLVTFAFAHCETVCPLIVHDVISVRDKLERTDPERTPAIVIVTLDPVRDTESRLRAIAKQWGLSGDAHVVSGQPDSVERALNRWRIPRVRNERTGDLSHPAIVYVIGPDGRITYAVTGNSDQILAAVRAL